MVWIYNFKFIIFIIKWLYMQQATLLTFNTYNIGGLGQNWVIDGI